MNTPYTLASDQVPSFENAIQDDRFANFAPLGKAAIARAETLAIKLDELAGDENAYIYEYGASLFGLLISGYQSISSTCSVFASFKPAGGEAVAHYHTAADAIVDSKEAALAMERAFEAYSFDQIQRFKPALKTIWLDHVNNIHKLIQKAAMEMNTARHFSFWLRHNMER